MHGCFFIVSFWLCFEQPLCSFMNGESIWRSQGCKKSIAWPYVAPRVFIAYFSKNDTSLRQNILKNLRVWERSLISGSIWCLFGVYLAWNLVGRKHHEKVDRKHFFRASDAATDTSFWRQTHLSHANGGVCHERPTDAATVLSDMSVVKASPRLSTMEELLTTSDRRWPASDGRTTDASVGSLEKSCFLWSVCCSCAVSDTPC
jgi:hypothetical protein